MIKLENISKYFGVTTAVDHISFEVKEGETMVLLGTSGCGKTTTLRMINRLIEPSSGIVWVNGENVLTQSPENLRKGIGYVLQHHGLFPHYTIAENIQVVPTLMHWNKEKKMERTRELMNKMQLPFDLFGHLYPRELSGGQQQRVGVARALASFPPVLLMDEPFGALDPVTRSDIRSHLMQLEEFNKKTIILVTHDIQEAFAYGDRICIMHNGTIVQEGPPEELLFHPANEFVSGFLKEQRMQLELKTVRLFHIWDLLPQASVENPATASLSEDNSVWELTDWLTLHSTSAFILNNRTNEVKEIALEGLLQAYKQYKLTSV
ncbi:MAG: ATP-binding cassette domain-containing protein [Chitinophagaceae bacterium]